MLDAATLENIKKELQALVPQGIGEALKALKEKLPANSPRQSEVVLLESRLNEANRDRLKGILSSDDLQLTYNRIRADLIELIQSLEPIDFEPAQAFGASPRKTGSLLYRIPERMKLSEETRCIVRLAFEEEAIIQNIELTEDTVLKSVRIAEVMSVELVDPNDEKPFVIRQVSSEEQFLEKGDYTEWVFYVTPLLEGTFPLLIKISVIEVVMGKERKKDIVLEESVQIVTSVESAQPAEAALKPSGYAFEMGGTVIDLPAAPPFESMVLSPRSPQPIPMPQAPAPAPNVRSLPKRGNRRWAMSIAASMLLIVAVSVVLLRQEFSSDSEVDYPDVTAPNDKSESPGEEEFPADTLDIRALPDSIGGDGD